MNRLMQQARDMHQRMHLRRMNTFYLAPERREAALELLSLSGRQLTLPAHSRTAPQSRYWDEGLDDGYGFDGPGVEGLPDERDESYGE